MRSDQLIAQVLEAKYSTEVLRAVARDTEDPELLDKLSQHSDPHVRYYVARHSWAPESAIRRLIDDKDSDVSRMAYTHPVMTRILRRLHNK